MLYTGLNAPQAFEWPLSRITHVSNAIRWWPATGSTDIKPDRLEVRGLHGRRSHHQISASPQE